MNALLIQIAGGTLGPMSAAELVLKLRKGEIRLEDRVKAVAAERWSSVREWAAVYAPEVLQPQAAVAVEKKSHVMAFLLSWILPGAGQWYAGARRPAVLYGLMMLFIVVACRVLHPDLARLQILGLISGLGLVSAIDALLSVERANKRP